MPRFRPTRRNVIVGVGSGAVYATRAAASGVPPGSSRFTAKVANSERGYDLPVHVHVPKTGGDGRPVLFVMHGLQRNASEYRDQWVELAEAHRVTLLVPEFSSADFPGREMYNFGGMIDKAGVARPRSAWNFAMIDQVFAAFVERSGVKATSYDLYGHSAGAQFAHRFALFGQSPIARRIVSANAGAYAWPTFDRPYPFGLGGTALTAADLAAFLNREGVVLLGEADVDPKHPSLPSDPAAAEQGPHRFARGQAFFLALQTASATAKVRLGWKLATVPGVAHSNSGMAAAAARILYA